MLNGKNVLITGGTGSLGRALIDRLLTGEIGKPANITVFSRDETKQHEMRLQYGNKLRYRIGDVRDYHSIAAALMSADVVVNAAALKQVPSCEYAPYEATLTNIVGAENIVRAIRENALPIETVVGISTDKACKPINVMGLTKAIQERIFIQANMDVPFTRFIMVRYGNVLASRGSVIPMFQEQLKRGEQLTVTTPEMTRFLLSLDDAVDIVFTALKEANRGEIYVPRIPSARIFDVAQVMAGEANVKVIGIRAGEKTHEILISDEEAYRTVERGKYYVLLPMLDEIKVYIWDKEFNKAAREREYSSADVLMSKHEIAELLAVNGMLEPIREVV